MKRIANLQKRMRLRKEEDIFSSYLKFGIPKTGFPLKNTAIQRGKSPLFSEDFATFQNELTFEIKHPCVSTKTPLRFNQNSLTFYLKRKDVLNRAQGRFSGRKKLHCKILQKDFTMQLI